MVMVTASVDSPYSGTPTLGFQSHTKLFSHRDLLINIPIPQHYTLAPVYIHTTLIPMHHTPTLPFPALHTVAIPPYATLALVAGYWGIHYQHTPSMYSTPG